MSLTLLQDSASGVKPQGGTSISFEADLRSETLAQRQHRVSPTPFGASFFRLNLEGRIRITLVVLWIGHVSRGLAITQEITVTHPVDALANLLDAFRVGLNHCICFSRCLGHFFLRG